MRDAIRTHSTLQSALYHVLRLALAALFALPLLWVVSTSLHETGHPPSRTIEWLPSPIAWWNYSHVFSIVPLAREISNSLIIVAAAVPLTIVTASWAGLGAALLPRRVRRSIVVIAILLLMVPASSVWITRFIIFKELGLIDTRLALIAPAVMGSSPLFILIYYWTFRCMPNEMFEAARLDGANALQIWRKIAMPMAWPATMAVSVLTFVLYWSDFVSPLLYLKSERLYTLPVGLQTLQQLDPTNWPLLMAGAAIVIAPGLLLFVLVQRYFWPEQHGL